MNKSHKVPNVIVFVTHTEHIDYKEYINTLYGDIVIPDRIQSTIPKKILASFKHTESFKRALEKGFNIDELNLGGGLGVRYKDEKPAEPKEYGQALAKRFSNADLKLILEPGRAIAANAGVLLTKVIYLKSTAKHNFAIVDVRCFVSTENKRIEGL